MSPVSSAQPLSGMVMRVCLLFSKIFIFLVFTFRSVIHLH